MKWRGGPVPSPLPKSFERPAAIVTLPALELRDKIIALAVCQHAVQRGRRQQSPDAVVEVLFRIACPQVISELHDSCSSGRATRQGRCHPDSQRGERGAVVRRIDAFERFEPDIEPLPPAVGALQLPEARYRTARRVARLRTSLRGIGRRKNQRVQY